MVFVKEKMAALSVLSLAALLATAGSGQAASSPRRHVLMDAGWRFHRGDLNAGATSGNTVSSWRWQASDAATADTLPPDPNGTGWQNATVGQDVFGGRSGFAWFTATLPDVPGPHRVLHFDSVDDNATVYLNGKRLQHHEGWDDPFDVPLDAAWKAGGPNQLAVLVENTAGQGGVGETRLQSLQAMEAIPPVALANYDDRTWRTVHLPHDFVIQGTFDPRGNAGHGALPTDVGYYRKTFTLPRSDRGKTLWLDFDGVYRNSTVWLNGQPVGRHACGYSPFHVDISRAANYGGTNTLVVRADARAQEGWWYEGGGIYRHVWLNVTEPIHVAPWGTFVTSDLPEPSLSHPATQATLSVKTTLANNSGQETACTLDTRILDERGRTVGTVSTPVTASAGTTDFAQQVQVANPSLWSPDFPHLYHAVTTVRQGRRIVDTYDTPFGIRTIRFDANQGFFLNGVPVKIKGTCNHQDFAGVGTGMPDSLQYWRVRQLKAIGSNAYRTSHNAPTTELLDACDREGMLVMDENRHLGDTESGKAPRGTQATDLSDLKAMVMRDRNHPSIIMWSMCNEEPLQSTDEGAAIFTAMRAAVLKIDPTRPVTCAMNGGQGRGISLVEDLVGFNYGPGAYDGYHQSHPTVPLYGSETASAVGARGVYAMQKFNAGGKDYYGDPEKSFVNAYDLNAPPWAQTAEDAWRPLAERPFMAGGFVWTGFDYKGEPTPFGWPDINSNFGILDECGFPKDSAWYYKAWWGGKPTVHILPHWNWAGREGQPIPVWVHSNAARVELSLNGQSLGSKDMPRYGHLEWSVPYAPGRLEARGFDVGGKLIATDVRETTGAPAALRLTTDRTQLTADGEDVTMVAVQVLDAQGRVMPTADNLVSFQVKGAGRIAGVGNGDPTNHEPDQAPQRHAFNGLCLVIVGANDKAGDIELSATSPGLTGATLRLQAQPAPKS